MSYDKTGKASHYNETRIEAMVALERIYGTEAAMIFCEMTAMKYRLRIGEKDKSKLELKKIQWYERTARMYREKLDTGTEIRIDNRIDHRI